MAIVLGRKGGGSSSGGGFSLIASQVLAANSVSIDLVDLDQSHENLQILALARTTEAVALSGVTFQFNGDVAANYDREKLRGLNVTAAAATGGAETGCFFDCYGASAAANAFTAFALIVPAYVRTVAHKAIVALAGSPDSTAANRFIAAHSHRWRNTAAITRITMSATSGNLLAGSGLWVYGID